MYALLEVQNSEQVANFVWLRDSALGEAGNEGSAVLMNIKSYIEGGERSLIVRGPKKKDGRLMKVSAAWEICRNHHGREQSSCWRVQQVSIQKQFGEAPANGWKEVRDGSKARRKPN